MGKLYNLFFDCFEYSKKFGLEGTKLWFKRIFFRNRIIKFNHKSYNHSIYLRNTTSDIPIFKQILLNEDYNIEIDFKPEIILDCGANIGLSAVYFANKFPLAKIYCIEPEKTNFELLIKNTINYPNITCIEAGLWNKDANLIIRDIKLGNYAFMVEEAKYKSEQTIEAISITNLMNTYNLKKIDILKIDIEGSEKEVFEINYINWLSITKIIIIELHDHLRFGASASFLNAISNFKNKILQKGENLICYLNT